MGTGKMKAELAARLISRKEGMGDTDMKPTFFTARLNWIVTLAALAMATIAASGPFFA